MTISVQRNVAKDDVFEFLRFTMQMTIEGACGFLGNLHAESGIQFDMVEGLLIQRLSEDGQKEWRRPVNNSSNIIYNNSLYTKRVDSGEISKEDFLSPRGRQYAYSICQLTTRSRKEHLWKNTKDKGKSISDKDGQLLTLKEELEGSYKSTLNFCRTTKNVNDASDYVLKHFEMPKITNSIILARRKYSNEYYNLYKNYYKNSTATQPTTSNTNNSDEKVVSKTATYDVNKLLKVAEAEIGYLEKSNGNNLDSKTAGASSGNWTKYWRDLKPSYQGQSWCDCWVSWIFMKAFGADAANQLLCGGLMSFYTPTSAQCFKNKGQWHTGSDVLPFDVVYFRNSQRIHHTGLVAYKIGNQIKTIEGNTSGASGVIPNGGGVCVKTYTIGDSRIAGYGRPNYGTVAKSTTATSTSSAWKATGTATVTGNTVYVRSTPMIASDNHIMTLNYGNRFEVDSTISNDWVHVKTGDTIGWIYGGYVKYDSAPTPAKATAKVETPTTPIANTNKHVTTVLNVRLHPGSDQKKCSTFGPLDEGAEVKVIRGTTASDGNEWYLVEYVSGKNPSWKGKQGWASAKYIK